MSADEDTEAMVEELSQAIFVTLHANGFDYFNLAQALVDNGWNNRGWGDDG